jgi:hypothetical protein
MSLPSSLLAAAFPLAGAVFCPLVLDELFRPTDLVFIKDPFKRIVMHV